MEYWKSEKMDPYRVFLEIPLKYKVQGFSYEGEIDFEPNPLYNLKVAVCSCNVNFGFPDQKVVNNSLKLKPQMALFLVDQFYESYDRFGIHISPPEKSYLDYGLS